RALIESLAGLGDLAGANLAYRSFRLRLREEMRADPAPETAALLQNLRMHARPGGAPSRGRGRPFTERIHTPHPISTLVGRRQEILEGRRLLIGVSGAERSVSNPLISAFGHRLVTLTGSVGVRKTRLASGLAHCVGAEF